jgi:uncharacterized membrane protein
MGNFGKALVLCAFIAYPILLHSFILKDDVGAWGLLLVFAPLLLALSWIVFRLIAKIWWPFGILLLAALIYYIVTGEHGRVGLLAVNGLSHATLNLFLLWLFGRTLLHGREPLISQISRHINGELKPEIALYTRQVTIAWCVFFALQVVTSLLLYVFSSVAAWSFFINVLNVPFLVAMFLGEYAYRILRHPDHHRTPILKAIEVYTKDFAVPKKPDNEH